MCSVQSNSENIMLMWLVTFPGQAPISMTYTNFSDANALNALDLNITTVVTNNEMGDFIESVLVLTVLQTVSMNGTRIECRSEALDYEARAVYINTSGRSD